MSDINRQSSALATAALCASLVSQTGGAVFAKTLFPVVGPAGLAGMRIGLAALILLTVFRPWRKVMGRKGMDRTTIVPLIAYGATLGLMNLLIYEAFARIPIGVAVAIEVTGPLLLALIGARRLSDCLWPLLAASGLTLLLPIGSAPTLDPVGVLFAVGAAVCWAGYIVTGKRVSTLPKGAAVAWGMLAASVLILPISAHAGFGHVTPALFGAAFAVAALSSAIPYTLEMFALGRLPARTLGVLVSMAPAFGAVAAMVVLGEQLSAPQWGAVALVVAASIGAASTAGLRAGQGELAVAA
jgi:inner membrane transporter RhtA